MTPSPRLGDLPAPPEGRTGWPWTEETPPTADPLPSVTIVMPCYQSADTLEESLRSVLLQGIPALQVVVMDGGSTDDTVEILECYAPWLHHWESRPDRGQTHAIAKGFARAEGDMINWHNADDILTPGSLQGTLRGFDRYPDAVYLSRHRLLMYPDGRIEEKPSRPKPGLIDLHTSLLVSSPGGQPGGLMRREAVEAVGGVDERFVCCMDEDLMMRMRIQQGPGYYLDNPGIIFRVHPDQKSLRLTRERVREKFLILKRSYDSLADDDPLQELKASSRIFAAGHAISLFRAAGDLNRAKYWHIRYRLACRRQRFLGRTIHTL